MNIHWIYLIVAICAEVIATIALKSADGFTRVIPSITVVVGYGAAFFLLSLTLKTMPVGIAYAVWSGIGIIFITIIGWIQFKQHLDAPSLIGIAFIVIGVAIMNLFSKNLM